MGIQSWAAKKLAASAAITVAMQLITKPGGRKILKSMAKAGAVTAGQQAKEKFEDIKEKAAPVVEQVAAQASAIAGTFAGAVSNTVARGTQVVSEQIAIAKAAKDKASKPGKQ